MSVTIHARDVVSFVIRALAIALIFAAAVFAYRAWFVLNSPRGGLNVALVQTWVHLRRPEIMWTGIIVGLATLFVSTWQWPSKLIK